MEVRIVGSSPDAPGLRQYASSYLINGLVCIDAGSIGFWSTPQDQSEVRHVLLTHTHMDHISSLPVFLDNAYDSQSAPVTLHATVEVLAVLQAHVFNGLIWPDFINLKPGGRPFVLPSPIHAGQELSLEGLRITPVPVDHQVPTVGYLVTDGRSTAIFGADSGPTDQIWQAARDFPPPYSVFIEASFPNRLQALAHLSMHLTPAMVGAEYAKMPPMTNVFVVHLKPRFRDEIERELAALSIPGLVLAGCDGVYSL